MKLLVNVEQVKYPLRISVLYNRHQAGVIKHFMHNFKYIDKQFYFNEWAPEESLIGPNFTWHVHQHSILLEYVTFDCYMPIIKKSLLSKIMTS
jgi:hypothetical protein